MADAILEMLRFPQFMHTNLGGLHNFDCFINQENINVSSPLLFLYKGSCMKKNE
jgi:hypothetical protein